MLACTDWSYIPLLYVNAAGFALRTEAAAVSRKQKTQKRHKAIRNKVTAAQALHGVVGIASCVLTIYVLLARSTAALSGLGCLCTGPTTTSMLR